MRGRFDVWAPRPERVRLAVGDDVVEMTKGDDGWWTPAGPVPEGEVDYGYLVDDGDTPAARPAVAPPAGRRTRTLAHLRPRRVRVERRALDRTPARRVGDLRAAPRHLHARGHARRRRRRSSTTSSSSGVDLVELLPVNAFNGTHNWGYDGVLWSAVDEEYGGPAAYQRFVDAAHAAGLGVIQDVVHNHLGPSGNYLPLFGPYVKTEGANTWGSLINLDGEESAEVRRFILDSVRMWFTDYHVDGLRLDAVHALSDESETHLLEEMAIEVGALSAHLRRPLTLIAESDLNDAQHGHPARGRRPRHRRAVERRLPPRRARGADR